MKSKIYLLVVLLTTTFIYTAAFCRAGSWLVKEDKLVHTDAMVILMGSIADRVLESVDRYKEGITSKVIIVEESRGAYKELEARGIQAIGKSEQVRDALVTLMIPRDSIIILPGEATSTLKEAMIIREYLNTQKRIDTLLIITSSPHTRRASIIFKVAFRRAKMPIYIVCRPSVYTAFNANIWWSSKEGIQLVITEYLKIASFMLFEISGL